MRQRSKKYRCTVEQLKNLLREEGFRLVRYKSCNLKKREWYISPECDILHVKDYDKEKNEVTFTIFKYQQNMSKNNCGYHIVNVGFSAQLHRLMAWTFLGEPEPWQTDVNHKDLNKDNNHIENLEWCTRSENMKHYWKNKKEA